MCVCVCFADVGQVRFVRERETDRQTDRQTELILFSFGESAVVHVVPPFCFFRLLTVGKYTLTSRIDKLKKVNAYHCFRHTAVAGGRGGGEKKERHDLFSCWPLYVCGQGSDES